MKTKEKFRLFEDGRTILKVLSDEKRNEVGRLNLMTASGLSVNRFNDAWAWIKKVSCVEIRKEGTSVRVRKTPKFKGQYANVALSKLLGITQREKAIAWVTEFKEKNKKGFVNIKSLEIGLKGNWCFTLTEAETYGVQKVLRDLGFNITLRKRPDEKIEFINPDKIGYDEILEKLEEEPKKIRRKKSDMAASTTTIVERSSEEPKKEIAVVSNQEKLAVVMAIEAMYRATGKEAEITDLPKLIENWSYMIIPEFRVRDILEVISKEVPGEIIQEGTSVYLGDYVKLKERYSVKEPWIITIGSKTLSVEDLKKILRPETIVSSGSMGDVEIHTLKITSDWTGIREGMDLVKFLRSGDYVSDPDFVREMLERVQVEISHISKTKEIYKKL